MNKTKDKEIDYYEYTPLDKKAFNADALAHTTDQSTDRFMPSSKYQAGTFVDKKFLGSLNLDDSSLIRAFLRSPCISQFPVHAKDT